MSSYKEDAEQKIAGEQAAYWLSELAEGQRSQRKAFAAWLRRSPRHVGEFLQVSAAWKEFGAARPMPADEIERIVAEAKAQKDASNVVRLGEAEGFPTSRMPRPRRPRHWLRIAAAAGVLVLATASLLWFVDAGQTVHSTAIGEQRALRLEDGSLLQLNTHSRIKVNFTTRERDIELLEGEALFTVQHDPTRPFRVAVAGATIEAVGTQFNIQRRSRDALVSVIEGRVRVNEQLLLAGEQASLAADGAVAKQTRADISDAIAWRERRLVFENDRLEDIVLEVNRYTPAHIRLDGTARDKRITGTFDADDPAALVLFLKKLPDLHVQDTAGGVTVRR